MYPFLLYFRLCCVVMLMALLYILLIVLAAFSGILITVYYFQESIIFHPEVLPFQHRFRFEGVFEERNFVLEKKVVIHALHFKVENPKGLIYHCHGNSGSMKNWGESATDFTQHGYDVLMYDYRSYGKSTGKIKTERMLYRDARKIYDILLKEYDESKVVIYGISLGTGIAAKVASKNNPRLLVLETPYYNFYHVARFHYPYLPNSVLLKYSFNTYRFLRKVTCPVWLLHGTNDPTIPYENSKMLAEISPDIQLISFPGGLHNNLNTFPDYASKMQTILG